MPSKPVIEIQNQIVGQALAITGTPFTLHYRSDRVPGRRASYSVKIPVSGKHLPARLKGIELEVSVAGQRFARSFSPAPEQSHTFIWDGKDAEGRVLQGKQLAKIRIGYTYRASFPRPETTRWRERTQAVGIWDARAQGLGGWSLSVHHAYDFVGRVLYLGDGGRRNDLDTKPAITPRTGPSMAGEHNAGTGEGSREAGDIILPAEDGSQLYIFDGEGQHLRTLHALTGGLLYRFKYDDGRLSAVEDGHGNVTLIEHAGEEGPIAIVAPYGQRTTLSTGADGYLASVTNPAGEAVQLTYVMDGLLSTVTDPQGNAHRFNYDDQGRLIRHDDPAGGSSSLASNRDGNGFVVAFVTSLGRESTYLVERLPSGEERRVNRCCGGRELVALSCDNGAAPSRKVTYPNRTVLSVLEQPDPRWGLQAPLLKDLSLVTPAGLASTILLDRKVNLSDSGNPLSATTITDNLSINGRKYTRTYDVTKKQITSCTPASRQTVTTIDDCGRVVKVEILGLLPIRMGYNEKGRLTTISQGDGDKVRIIQISRSADGTVSCITDPLKRTMGFEYDRAGRVTRQILRDGRAIARAYDKNGNLQAISPPGRPAHAFEYTPLNLSKGYLPPRVGSDSKDTIYVHNEDEQLIKVEQPNGKTIDLAYDSAGRLATMTFLEGKLCFEFDADAGPLKTITSPDGTLSYTYDGFLLTSTTWDGVIVGSVSQSHDNDLRVVSSSVNGNWRIENKHDLDGLLTQTGSLSLERDLENGFVTATKLHNLSTLQEHNGVGEREAFRAVFNDTDIFACQYDRDALGRITKKVEMIDGDINTYAYDYDLTGRLADVTRDGVKIARYEFDGNGNRLTYEGPDGTLTGTYDVQDRVIRYGDITYLHTDNGEWASTVVNGNITRYAYDAFGNLRVATLPDGTKIEFLIDGLNRRIGKKINAKLVQGFLYDGRLRPIAELDGANNLVSRFVYATKINVPEYMEQGGKTYRFITDHLGSPRLVMDAITGTVAQRMDYDEFGQVLRDTNPGFQPFGFAGGLYDPQTKLVRFGARDYEPHTARWTAKDPILFASGDTNTYEYVQGDPVNRIDATGLGWWDETIGRIIFETINLLSGDPEPVVPVEHPAPIEAPGSPSGPGGAGPGGNGGSGGKEPPWGGILRLPGTFNCLPLIIFTPAIESALERIRCSPAVGSIPDDCSIPIA